VRRLKKKFFLRFDEAEAPGVPAAGEARAFAAAAAALVAGLAAAAPVLVASAPRRLVARRGAPVAAVLTPRFAIVVALAIVDFVLLSHS